MTRAALNRPIFTQGSFDSGALTVLTTLLHHFREAGSYEALIRRGGRLVARVPIEVAEQHSDRQVNIDMADGDDAARGCCSEHAGTKLAIGGVAGFYVSRGTGRYSVRITVADAKRRDVVLDSTEVVPAGDLFAVTLVRPGAYRMTAGADSRLDIDVRVPKPKQDYRPDRPVLVELGEGGKLDPQSLKIFSGQSVIVRCASAVRLHVELVKPRDDARPTGRGAGR